MPTHVKPKTFEHPYPDHPLLAIFSLIEDPRRPSPGFRYPFLSVLFMALVSVICGAKDWAQVVVISEGLEIWLSHYVDMAAGVPCEQTFVGLVQKQTWEGYTS